MALTIEQEQENILISTMRDILNTPQFLKLKKIVGELEQIELKRMANYDLYSDVFKASQSQGAIKAYRKMLNQVTDTAEKKTNQDGG